MGKVKRSRNPSYAKSNRLKGKSAIESDDEELFANRRNQGDSDDDMFQEMPEEKEPTPVGRRTRAASAQKSQQSRPKVDLLNEESDDDEDDDGEKREVFAMGGFDSDEDEDLKFSGDDSYDEDEEEELGEDIDRRLKYLEAQTRKQDMASDLEDGSDDEDDSEKGLPSSLAWGKERRSYYSADYVDKDYRKYTAEEEEMALSEQREAENIEKRLLEEMDPSDPLSDWLGNLTQTKVDSAEETPQQNLSKTSQIEDTVKIDLSKLNLSQKIDMVKKDSPELWPLIDDYEHYSQVISGLSPLIKWFSDATKKTPIPETCPLVMRHAVNKFHLIGRYLTSLSCYVLVKASSCKSSRTSTARHPKLIQHLIKLKKLITQLEELEDSLPSKLSGPLMKLCERMEYDPKSMSLDSLQCSPIESAILANIPEETSLARHKVTFEQSSTETEVDLKSSQDNDEDTLEYMDEDEDEPEDKKRAITKEILKNRGLTPKRKKEQRNPRVKHRNRFKRANVRRKGQVRGIRPRSETANYGGELSGIRAATVRSIKLKR